ncbi:(2Fe-2S)-binding protein [Kibdelosporangium aridum]|uniref:(2Fe-2S)-binding protein n=1 Tax=Kibdelosporangium aridum TaxID=2030 RepID=A0A428Z2U7_KIBAR|nr:2Fe-2S iron-sulfur cluster-binding protein [Kibdelosporangium aridum]RSM80041.1 (2Fe-2S)-binding protein [Kibdelosporangium aridum]
MQRITCQVAVGGYRIAERVGSIKGVADRTIRLNGKKVSAPYRSVGAGAAENSEQLLYWLRERHDQHGPRFGCGVSQCGACTVLLDGAATRSCTRQVHTVPDMAEVLTLDGLRGHPLQRAFVTLQAGQCAFCVNGMVMGALGWLSQRVAAGNRTVPADEEIKDFLSGALPESDDNYICRCGAHTRIVAAISAAAKEMLR